MAVLTKAEKRVKQLEVENGDLHAKIDGLEKALDEKATDDLASFNVAQVAQLRSDLAYERSRRVSAENKAYALEQKLFALGKNHLSVQDLKDQMQGMFVTNCEGKIA